MAISSTIGTPAFFPSEANFHHRHRANDPTPGHDVVIPPFAVTEVTEQGRSGVAGPTE
jgi:hypothetical protein